MLIQKGRLGGYTHTYIDPVTGAPFDYGVIGWHNIPTVTNYFNRFNISLTPLLVDSSIAIKFANFRTGKLLPNYTEPAPQDIGAALGVWYSICGKYPTLPYGYNLTYPVDEDLLAPFSDTVTKYHLQAIVPLIWQFSHSNGDMMSLSTLYVIQNFGIAQLAFDYVTTTSHTNSELYTRTAALLGSRVLHNSTATKIYRGSPDEKQYIIVEDIGGRTKLIKAKKDFGHICADVREY